MSSAVLDDYFRGLARHPLLTVEEERVLAHEIAQAGASAAELEQTDAPEAEVERAQVRLRRAKKRMVEANLRLVVSIAKRFANRGTPLADLVQEGNIGLMAAVDRFDPAFGTRFSTYGSWWIQESIRRFIQSTATTIRVPVHVREVQTRIAPMAASFASEFGRDPTAAELAAATGLPAGHVTKALQARLVEARSLDQTIGPERALRLIDALVDHDRPSPFDQVDARERAIEARRLLDRLTPREAEILHERFVEGRTLADIGHGFGLSRERVRQIEAAALKRMRSLTLMADTANAS